MPHTTQLGTAVSRPGSIQYGQWDAFTHATGHVEFLPVIIAQGNEQGPCIWLTAAIHGVEHTGPWVIHELLTQDLVEKLQGTIIAIPSLCPVGLRVNQYVPYIVEKNPNRLWPEDKPKPSQRDPEKRPPFPLETAYQRLFEKIKQTAKFLIDYHNASIGSIPFVYRDRILFRSDQNMEENQAEAQQLAKRLDKMLTVFGFTIVNENLVEKYIDEDLHRSTSGAVLMGGRIPAFTVELGGGQMPDKAIVKAAVAGTRNVLRWVGIAIHLKQPGEMVAVGEPIAELRDIWPPPTRKPAFF